jgi:tRNA-splicing ligase RtcB
MQLIDGTIPVFGEADEKTLKQIRTCAKTADKVALMPDNHLGYGVPIGGVVATGMPSAPPALDMTSAAATRRSALI